MTREGARELRKKARRKARRADEAGGGDALLG